MSGRVDRSPRTFRADRPSGSGGACQFPVQSFRNPHLEPAWPRSPKSKAAHPKAKPAASGAPATEAHAPLGKGGELHQQADGHRDHAHDQSGRANIRQSELAESRRAGPVLLEDFVLREKITHFDHERIPERVVHARGSAAHGFFDAYEPLTKITTADFLQRQGESTAVFVRFSTVAGNKGSPDLARDVRGFAVKFYTKQGNFDLVGNNMPVFFIQDAIKFPDLIHAAKHEPDREFPQARPRMTRSGTSSR